MKPSLALCYYPTNIVFIDDDRSLLEALALVLGEKFNCLTYTDPHRALNHASQVKPKEWHYIENSDSDYVSDTEQFINKALNISAQKIEDLERYKEISVVIVDYDMPQMNGLEFCKKLNNPAIKKILLTGRIGADEAVKAFNEKLIDYYISKYEKDLHSTLVQAIEKLQKQYFLDVSSLVKIKAVENKKNIFSDEILSEYIGGKIEEYDIQEYYFLTHPSRYRMVKKDGTELLLLVCSRMELNEHIKVIKEEAGPKWLIEALKTELYVPYFESKDGFYEQESFDKEKTLRTATVIEGREKYYCALIENGTKGVDPTIHGANSNTFH